MPFRVSLRHVQQAGPKTAGWSANFWNNAGDLSAVITSAQALRDLLNQVTGAHTLLPSARISKADDFRNVSLQNYIITGVPANPTNPSDYPSTALLLKLTSAGPYETLQWIRGIPDDVVDKGGTYNPGGLTGFTAKLNKFLAALVSGSNLWCQRKLNRAVLSKPIDSVALQTGIVTAPGHGLGAAGALVVVRIKGYQYPKGLNRVWNARILTGDTFQLTNYLPPSTTAIPAFGKNPSVRLQSYTYVQITDANIVRATSHYTGRPLELLGGRRRTRRTSRSGLPVDA